MAKFGYIVMCISWTLKICQSAETETIDRDFCDGTTESRRYELESGDSLNLIWNGQQLTQSAWGSCSVSVLGKDRKLLDLKDWTLCATVDEFEIMNCEVEVWYYAIFVFSSEPDKVYNCSTPIPKRFCTTETVLRIVIKAAVSSSSHFKIKISASEDKTDEIVHDVMFYVKIGLGVVGGLFLLGSVIVTVLCIKCRKKNRYADVYKDADLERKRRNQLEMQNVSKPV